MTTMSDIAAMQSLDRHCTDYTIHKRDFWRPNIVQAAKLQLLIRYEVHCGEFFVTGSGLGRSLSEAVHRALRHMGRRKQHIEYGTAAQLKEL